MTPLKINSPKQRQFRPPQTQLTDDFRESHCPQLHENQMARVRLGCVR